MADDDRARWDARHDAAGVATVAPPEGLGDAGIDPPLEGAALDVACGRGGTSVWMALRGMDVAALDVSPVALRATSALAAAHGVEDRIRTRVVDLDDGLPADVGLFDLIVCQRYRQPDLIADLASSLTPRGLLVTSVLSVVGADDPGRFHAPAGEMAGLAVEAGLAVSYESESDGLAVVVARR